MNKAETKEPKPTPRSEAVLPHVLKDLQDRSDFLEKNYGIRIETFNDRDALMNAYQKALNVVLHLHQAISDREDS